MDQQTVYKHLESHRSGRPDQSDIILKTLHKNITYQDERICTEAFEIHNRSENIMNDILFLTREHKSIYFFPVRNPKFVM